MPLEDLNPENTANCHIIRRGSREELSGFAGEEVYVCGGAGSVKGVGVCERSDGSVLLCCAGVDRDGSYWSTLS